MWCVRSVQLCSLLLCLVGLSVAVLVLLAQPLAASREDFRAQRSRRRNALEMA